jgi:hypothetical protein
MQMMQTSNKSNVLDDTALADVFGIEMATADTPPVTKKKLSARTKPAARTIVAPLKPVIVSKAVTKKRAAKKKVVKKTAIAARVKQTATLPKKAKTLATPKTRRKRITAD